MNERPIIVCLCGSTRFRKEFEIANMNESLSGKIVISLGMFGHADYPRGARYATMDCSTKKKLDELHLRKIDLADEILVINVDNYIGDSTRREIEYAQATNKRVRFLFNEYIFHEA